ncbi:uncharacterized protein [Epargyreus clarus]|uniref:uncharacterized protein n=1 Tax=Epargyreus clarus TaxID=520877 RepID=UPI003C2AF7DD
MKLLILCAIIFYCIISSDARLILRTTDKPKDEMTSNDNVKDISSSKEEIDGPEIIHYYKGKVRTPRQDDNTQKKNATRKNTDTQAKSKTALVKKPIPKYKDAESDEDYQSKHIKTKWPSKLVDSAEHEDEDFSLDDYDFDVNHDEFIGRGKPLEPRKELRRAMEGSKTKSAQKTKRNLIRKIINAERNNLEKITKKAGTTKENDCNDNFPTTVSSIVVEINPINREEDTSDEPEDSNEDHVFIRNARSPWTIGSYVDKLGEKTSVMMTKILSFLPLFPQIPETTRID